MNLWQLIFDAFVIMFFVLLNGFFVAAEFAIVKVRMTQIETLVQKGNWHAKVTRNIITHLNAYLSATQLGITMTSLALGWLGEPLVAAWLVPLLQKFGSIPTDIVHAIAFGVAFSIITFLHIVLGELAPKSLAILEPKKTALLVSYPLNIFFIIFKPAIRLLNSMANMILRMFGLQTVESSELEHSEEELRLIIAHDTNVSATTRNIALNALDFNQKQARHAMVPRKDITALSIQAPLSDNIAIMQKNKFSRFPAYKDTIDNIIGIVYTKDIFKQSRHLEPDFALVSVIRDAIFMPETATLEKILKMNLQKKSHMIILADEYGGTAGLITLENVLEELVGNIQDEFDREKPDVVRIDENEFMIAGDITTNDVEKLMAVELSPMDIRSIGSLLIEQLGHIPSVGEQLKMNGIEFTIEKVNNKAIESIRLKRLIPNNGNGQIDVNQ